MSGIVGKNSGRGSGIVGTAALGADAVGLAEMAGGTDGNIISYDASGDPVAIATGDDGQVLTSTGAGSPPAFEAAAGGGDLRNFIINGDMELHPDGDITDFNGSEYVCALWEARSNWEGTTNTSQSTTVPTQAQSSHQSKYSLKLDVGDVDSSISASNYYGFQYHVTGSDFAYLHKRTVTLSFWHYGTKTGVHCVAFQNSAADRSYVAEYTVASTLTWQLITITVALDTSGTWLFTDADIGLTIIWTLAAGTDEHTSAGAWAAGNFIGTSNQVNVGDHADNVFQISQVGLYLGSSAPTFLGESIATVQDQVAYYINREIYDNATSEPTGHVGQCNTTTNPRGQTKYARPMRIVPTVTFSAAATFDIQTAGNVINATGVGSHVVGKYNHSINMTVSSGLTGGNAWTLHRDGTDACYIQYDARH